MLKAVFGVDPNLSNEFHIYLNSQDKKAHYCIEFDSGEKHSVSLHDTHKLLIPENATKMTITSDNYIFGYGCCSANPAIVSIEEFTSDSIKNCSCMFYGFTNVKEIKNINLNWDNIINGRYMCANWYSFNGILPDDFCSNMNSLKYADDMFADWRSFNQELPYNFCINMNSLMFANRMFYGWKSFNQNLPYNFFPDTSSILWTEYMFFGWWLCNKTPTYELPKYIHDYKQKDINEFNYLIEKYKEEIMDYRLISKLTNKEIVLCLKGNIDYYALVDNEYILFSPNKPWYISNLKIDVTNDSVIIT